MLPSLPPIPRKHAASGWRWIAIFFAIVAVILGKSLYQRAKEMNSQFRYRVEIHVFDKVTGVPLRTFGVKGAGTTRTGAFEPNTTAVKGDGVMEISGTGIGVETITVDGEGYYPQTFTLKKDGMSIGRKDVYLEKLKPSQNQ